MVVERWLDLDLPQVLVPSVRWAMGPMSAVVFGEPARDAHDRRSDRYQRQDDGVYLLDAVLRAAGRRPGAIGTVGRARGGSPIPLARTTPEAPDLQRLLARMRGDGRHDRGHGGVVACARSRSGRGDACSTRPCSRTSRRITWTITARWSPTSRRRRRCSRPGEPERALVNLDDPWGRRLLDLAVPVTTYGLDPGADVRAEDVRATVDGLAFRVGDREVTSPLRGAFNVSNCLAAIAASGVIGVDVEDAILGRGEHRAGAGPDGAGGRWAGLPGGGGLRAHAG